MAVRVSVGVADLRSEPRFRSERVDQAVYEQVGKTGMGTLQIGAVEPLSLFLEVPVLRDMRSTDVAAGGMGAPLVPRADELMFGRGSAVLNMGGIANLTLLGSRTTGFDTGPGNMLIDEAARLLFGKEFDRNGSIARSGKQDTRILSSLLKDPFVNSRPPKSCDFAYFKIT